MSPKRTYFILTAILIIGAVLRFGGLNWGFPYMLHPDEGPFSVRPTITMLSNESFEPSVLNRPDHLEIKINSITFTVYSYLRYHCPAPEAWNKHMTDFYFLARCFTALCGVILIYVSYLVGQMLGKNVGLISALFTALFPSYITHSHYSTPDIPLTLCILLVIYFCMRYLKEEKKIELFWASAFIGIGATIKYPSVIMCFLIFIVVSLEAYRKRSIKVFFGHGSLSVGAILLAIMFVSPVLLTQPLRTLQAIIAEQHPAHPSADGLNYFQTLAYYMQEFILNSGILFVIVMLLGVIFLARDKKIYTIPILGGVVYWLGLSIITLHWERWAQPMYLTGILVAAYGLCRLCQSKKIMKPLMLLITIILVTKLSLQSVGNMLEFVVPDSRLVALEYCQENGITSENSLAEGYTPFRIGVPTSILGNFEWEGNKLVVKNNYSQYIVLGSGMYGRYQNEPQKYQSENAIYRGLEDQFEKIYETPSRPNANSYFCIISIVKNVHRIVETLKLQVAGSCLTSSTRDNIIRIYKIEPSQYQYPFTYDVVLSALKLGNAKFNDDGHIISDKTGGLMVYGPYITLGQGNYAVNLTLTAAPEDTDSDSIADINIVVTAESGKVICKEETVHISRGTETETAIFFNLQATIEQIEVTIYTESGDLIELSNMRIEEQ